MSDIPYFSVIIPTYNRENILPYTVGSVLDQTFQNFELLIIDNGSTDCTSAYIEELNHPKIRFFKQEGSGSPASPRNSGILNSSGEWICFLDSDDDWTPNKLEKVHEAIKNHPGKDVVSHYQMKINQISGSQKKLVHYSDADNLYKCMSLEGTFLSTSAIAIRREFLIKHKLLFNESEDYIIVEDYDLWLRIANKGAGIYFIQEVLGNSYTHNANLSGNLELFISNLENLYREHAYNIQSFTTDKDLVYKRLRSLIHRSRAYQHLTERRVLVMLKDIFLSLILDPSVLVKLALRKLRKK